MEKISLQSARRYWLFQGRPDRYDLDKHLSPGATESWTLSRYRDEVSRGDIVYFWRSGRQAALVGWGEVSGEALAETIGEDLEIPVTYRVRFSRRIERDALTDSTAGLSTLNVLRNAAGTNFKVTTLEAVALNRLVSAQGDEAPPMPEGIDTGRIPVLALSSLNPGNTVRHILEAARHLAGNELLDGMMLLDATLAVATERGQRGTIDFLRGFFQLDKGPLVGSSRDVEGSLADAGNLISREALDILEAARLLAISSIRREEIGVRHLFAALLQAARDETLGYAGQLCRKVDRSLSDLVVDFVESTAAAFTRDDTATWVRSFRGAMEDRLAQGLNLRPGTSDAAQVPARESVPKAPDIPKSGNDGSDRDQAASPGAGAGYAALAEKLSGRLLSDRPSGSDHLRIRAEVAALAHAFARRGDELEQEEPARRATIALGLFGRWGSGKSFFMTRLRKEIERLTALEPAPGERRVYCERVEQIEFNAWHYKESDLWASLVHHIFDRLQKRFEREGKAEEFKKLIEQLDISQEQRTQIEQELNDKTLELRRIETAISEKEKEIDTTVDEQLTKIASLPDRLAKNAAARETLRQLLPHAGGLLGLDKAALESRLDQAGETAEEMLGVIRNSGAAAAEARGLGRLVLQSISLWPLAGVAALLLAVYSGLPILLGSPRLWDSLMSETTQLVALFAPFVAWVTAKLKGAASLLDQIDGVRKTLEEDVRQQERQRDAALSALQSQFQRIEQQIAEDKKRRTRIEEEIDDIEERLARLGSSQSLVDFINERAGSSDYRARLGILALIRRDFETLSSLMTGWDEGGLDPSARAIAIRASKQDGSTASPAPSAKLDRIILYIDDLDRVSDSHKVLKVMEAVHLLLALPLFNVVVAVDEWWAAQSVLAHYKDYFAADEPGADPGTAGVSSGSPSTARHPQESMLAFDKRKATPREFLEKVFQICLWVRPLGQELAERLIDGTVELGDFEEPGDPATGEGSEPLSPSSKPGKAPDASKPEQDAETESAANPSGLAGDTGKPSTADDSGAQTPVDAEEEGLSEDPERHILIADRDFAIGSDELATLRALARIVGRSPRTVKRFINTYRLNKAILVHQLPEAEDDPGATDVEKRLLQDHVPIMFLLAVQIGQPDVATRFFETIDQALAENDQQMLVQVLKTARDAADPDLKWRTALTTLLEVLNVQKDVLRLDKIVGFDPWLLQTARFGFEEWEPRSERLWR